MDNTCASTSAVDYYIDAAAQPPAIATWPIPETQWKHFVDADALVTFTAAVPLDTLVTEGPQGVKEYVEQAFDRQVTVCSAEYRVVGHLQPDEFDEAFIGDVVLQVSCNLISRD